MKQEVKLESLLGVLVVGILVFLVGMLPVKAMEKEYVNYNGIHISSSEYQTLHNLGFSNDEIYYMPEDIYNENKDLSASLLSQTQKYYKTVYTNFGTSYTEEITEDEYYNHEEPLRGYIQTAYKTVISSISANGSRYRYKVTESWNNIPSNKSYDVIAIGYSGNIHIYSTITFYFTYTTSNGSTTTSYTAYNKQYGSDGGSAVYKLPNSFVGLSSLLYFDVEKDSGAGTITSLHMCGDYAHSTQTVTGAEAASHGLSIGGINFSGNVVNKFDAIPCADTYMNVNW